MPAYGKIPQRPPGRWQERQAIAERFASEGWGIQRRWRRVVGVSIGSLVTAIAATAAVSAAAAWLTAFGYSFDGGTVRQRSVEQLILKRLLVETSAEELSQTCGNAIRLGGGLSGSGGWQVCLQTALGERWEAAHKAPGGGGKQWATVGAGRSGLDPTFDVELALQHDCVVDVFDLGVDIYKNDFQEATKGWQGRIHFHSRGLSEREGAVSAPHVRRLELVKSNATEFRDIKTVHPGYDVVAQGPGWSYQGHSGSEWRIKSPAAHPQTATSRPVAPLGALLKRAEPKYCENLLSEGSPGCQIDILKIDCGSCEWNAFRQLWDSTDALTLAQVDQVLVEAHLSDWQERAQPRGDVWKMIALLESAGFDLFSVEPNTDHAYVWPAPWGYGSAPSVIRLGWVRRRRSPRSTPKKRRFSSDLDQMEAR